VKRLGAIALLIVWMVFGAWAGYAQVESRVDIAMVAVRASQEGRKEKAVERSLTRVRETLESIDEYDTFRMVRTSESDAAYQEECRLPINNRYTLLISPIGRDASGRIRLRARIEEQIRRDEKLVKRIALEATTSLAQGRPLKLCGLRLEEEGELVVIVTVRERPASQTTPSQDTSSGRLPRMTFH